jgi:predicted DNA-binding transcriptional regulator YafY
LVLAPTARLLEMLELLQSRPVTTGRELADRLGVDTRTVRRYIAALQELDIPVEGQRGVGGGYRVRPGFRLPPLMLNEDEAVMVVLGLVAARRLAIDSAGESVDGALVKIHRVLPATLRRRVEALETTLGFTTSGAAGVPVSGDVVLLLADAIRRRRRLRSSYRSFSGAETEREISPHGLVVHSGRWYLAAHDHTRDDLRTFRVDRMSRLVVIDEPALAAQDGFDAVTHVSRSLARVPWTWEVEVVLDVPVDQVANRIPPTLGELFETQDGTLLRMRVSSLDWMATVLAGLDCSFTVHRPAELRASVRRLADRLSASAAES